MYISRGYWYIVYINNLYKIKENKLLRFIGKNSGLYYLMIGTVTKAWGKVYQCIIGTSKNEYIYFFLHLH